MTAQHSTQNKMRDFNSFYQLFTTATYKQIARKAIRISKSLLFTANKSNDSNHYTTPHYRTRAARKLHSLFLVQYSFNPLELWVKGENKMNLNFEQFVLFYSVIQQCCFLMLQSALPILKQMLISYSVFPYIFCRFSFSFFFFFLVRSVQYYEGTSHAIIQRAGVCV